MILRGSEVKGWTERRWGGPTAKGRPPQDGKDWWILKATGANGGVDVFVLHEGVVPSVLARLQAKELYVVQRYITRPLLYQGRKFHFRYVACGAG